MYISSKYHDNRPGFYEGRPIRGFIEPRTSKRKPYLACIERHFVVWSTIMTFKCRTEEDAEETIQHMLEFLNQTPERKYV